MYLFNINRLSGFVYRNTNLKVSLSDFLKLTFTVLKAYFEKPKPKTFVYRDYKTFLMRDFIYIFYLELKNVLITHLMVSLLHLLVFLTNTLHSKRYVSGNQKDFMNKELSRAVIVSSKL